MGGAGGGGAGGGRGQGVNSYALLSAEEEEDEGVAFAGNVNGKGGFGLVPLSSSSEHSDSDSSAEMVTMTSLDGPAKENTDETVLLQREDDDDDDEPGGGGGGVHLKKPPKETFLSISLQIFFPFLIAGMGMVGAGLVLDVVQHWKVFQVVSELFILVPALLGLKGNLEMTLASRLSTHANLGNMDSKEDCWSLVVSNLALIQCQAIVVALLASLFAMGMDWAKEGVFDLDHALLLCASSLVTASLASFVLGLVMVFVILFSRRCHINPDNVATPIAASLGDLTTLALLSWIAQLLFTDLERDKWLAPVIVGCYLLVVPACVCVARFNQHTAKVLRHGWSPVLAAMVISSLGGLMLDQAVAKFDGIAVFQPVINGVGGNLVAVQASRISTHLHALAPLGTLPESDSTICLSPWAVFFGASPHARTAKILLFLVVPGHLIFTYAIVFLEAGHTSPTFVFIVTYLTAALLQVWILLHTAHWLIHWFWRLYVNPDDSAIPYLTALGDLLGGGLLWMAFEFLYVIGDKDADVGD